MLSGIHSTRNQSLIERIGCIAGNKTSVYSISSENKKWRNVCNLSSADDRDTLIRVGTGSKLAHSLVLAASSPFMEAIFRFDGFKAKKVVDLSAVLTNEISLNRIISHFYCRWVKLDDDFLLEILNASSFLMCEQFAFKCSQFLLKHLSANNCFGTWILAEMYHFPHLAIICRDFLRELIPSVTEYINVEKIPVWFCQVLLESLESELNGSAFKLLIQLNKWLSIHCDQSEFASKLFQSYYFTGDSCFNKIWSRIINPTAKTFPNLVEGFNGLTCLKLKPKKSRAHSVVFVKEDGNPSIALYCDVGKCWTSINLSRDYGSIIGIVHGIYLVFFCSKTNKVTFYHMLTAKTFPIKNVFPSYLSWMETCNLSRTYFVSIGKLYIAFCTRNAEENSVLLNVFSYSLYLMKWKRCFHVSVPGTWNMCNIQALNTDSSEVHVVLHAYYANPLISEQFSSVYLSATDCRSFIFCIEPKKKRLVKRLSSIPQKYMDKPVFILNKKEYLLLEHRLYQSCDTPLTWTAHLQKNTSGDEIFYNVPMSKTPAPCLSNSDNSGTFCITHMYMSSDSVIVAQHRAPTILWVFIFNLCSRNLVMLPPVPINATSRNLQVSSFYSDVPLSSRLKKTVKTIVPNKCYFKNMTFDDCCSFMKERDKTTLSFSPTKKGKCFGIAWLKSSATSEFGIEPNHARFDPL